MNEQLDVIEQPEVTVGERLKQAREAAGISLEEFAKQLNLMSSQLTKLENNEFEALGPVTFVKGYIKNYCRAFGLDSNEILALFKGDVDARQAQTMQSFSRRTHKEAHDSRLMLVSYIILAVVLGSSALWWWQDSARNKMIPVTGQTQTLQNTLTTDAQALPLQESAQDALPEENPNSESVPQEIEPDAESAMNQAQSEQVDGMEPAPSLAPGESLLVMRFRADSWVEIIDARGERVAFGIKKAGYVMTLSGVAPFSVVLGKHDVVDIELNGERVDISYFPKNRLAKFSLPLKE